MARGRRSKTAVQINTRMHRPHLTRGQAALAEQYRPGPCEYCQAQFSPERRATAQWLMEPPKDGKPLQFYCSECGKYVSVEPLAREVS